MFHLLAHLTVTRLIKLEQVTETRTPSYATGHQDDGGPKIKQLPGLWPILFVGTLTSPSFALERKTPDFVR